MVAGGSPLTDCAMDAAKRLLPHWKIFYRERDAYTRFPRQLRTHSWWEVCWKDGSADGSPPRRHTPPHAANSTPRRGLWRRRTRAAVSRGRYCAEGTTPNGAPRSLSLRKRVRKNTNVIKLISIVYTSLWLDWTRQSFTCCMHNTQANFRQNLCSNFVFSHRKVKIALKRKVIEVPIFNTVLCNCLFMWYFGEKFTFCNFFVKKWFFALKNNKTVNLGNACKFTACYLIYFMT